MGIDINVRLHGGEIGQALLGNPEEFYYTLEHIAEGENTQEMQAIAHDVAQYVGFKSREVVQFLRILADEIEGGGTSG